MADLDYEDPVRWEVAAQTRTLLSSNASLLDAVASSKFIGGDSLSIADFALAPLIFALGHGTIAAKTGFSLPGRWRTFITEFTAACPAAVMLSSAGGYSISEFLDSKA